MNFPPDASTLISHRRRPKTNTRDSRRSFFIGVKLGVGRWQKKQSSGQRNLNVNSWLISFFLQSNFVQSRLDILFCYWKRYHKHLCEKNTWQVPTLFAIVASLGWPRSSRSSALQNIFQVPSHDTWRSWWLKNPAPVEVGSLPQSLIFFVAVLILLYANHISSWWCLQLIIYTSWWF